MRLEPITSGVWESKGLVDTIHIAVCMKPTEGSFAQNALAHGAAGLNIDGCRIGETTELHASEPRAERTGFVKGFVGGTENQTVNHGRWPSNIILDGSEKVKGVFPETGKSAGGRVANISKKSQIYGGGKGLGQDIDPDDVRGDPGYGDEGSAARYFKQCEADNMKEDDDERENQ